MNRRGACVLAVLAAVVLVGAGLRFTGITEQGPRLWDEANYILEGRWMLTVAQTFTESARIKVKESLARDDSWHREEQADLFRDRVRGKPPIFGRLTHNLIIAGAMALLGDHFWAGAAANALIGVLSIIAVFLLGRAMYGSRTGLAAAFVLALSGYHVLYSRGALAEIDSTFFALLALLFYYKSRKRIPEPGIGSLATAGILLGIAYTTHNRIILLFALFWGYELHLWIWRKGASAGTLLKRFVVLNLAILFPMILWEVPYYVAFSLSRHLDVVLHIPSYFEQTVKALGIAARHGYGYQYFEISGFLTYPFLSWHLNGPVITLLPLVGIYFALRKRSLADFLVGTWFAFLYAYFSLTAANTRYLIILLPAAALLAARPLASPGFATTKRGIALVAMICAAVAVSGIAASVELMGLDDGYREAAAWIEEQGDPRHLSTHQPLTQVYAGVDAVERSPGDEAELEALFRKGHRYLLVDSFRYHLFYSLWLQRQALLLDRVQSALEPVHSVPNPYGNSIPQIFEGNMFFFDSTRMLGDDRFDEAGWIRIYDLADYFPGEGPGIQEEPGFE